MTNFRQVEYRDKALSLSVNERLTSSHLIVCLPGLGCSKDSFNELFKAPELREHSICAIDLPGHGTSDKPDDLTFTMEEYAGIVDSLIDQIGPSRLSVVAHSMGGAIGLLLPDLATRIERFISVEGNLVAEDCGIVSRRIAGQSLQEFTEVGFAELLHTLQSSERADLKTWAGWLGKSSPIAVHRNAQSLVEWSDSGRLLETFNALDRTSYIYGNEDSKDFLLHRLEATSITAIADAGHFCMIDKPTEFRTAVLHSLN